MRCKGCNAELSGRTMNEHTNDLDDLCSTCRGWAYQAADSANYEELVPENYRWPAKRIDPDD
jgi:hypothetical protein